MTKVNATLTEILFETVLIETIKDLNHYTLPFLLIIPGEPMKNRVIVRIIAYISAI